VRQKSKELDILEKWHNEPQDRIRTQKYLGNVDPDPYKKIGIRNPVVTSFKNLLQASKGKKC